MKPRNPASILETNPAQLAVSRFTDAYQGATERERKLGATWYTDARRECVVLASEYYRTLATVVGIVAALSQREPWDRNLQKAETLLRTGNVPGLQLAVRKAQRILQGAQPRRVLSGRKVRAFYNAILGDPQAVVIDSHMLRAAGHHRAQCSDYQYAVLETALREAASRLHVAPRTLQATVWVVQRGRP